MICIVGKGKDSIVGMQMKIVTLVIMSAGIGSRYGGGIKQLASVGPNGEIIMDYSIYDALEAGFNKVVFIIRREIEKDFKEIIGKRIEKFVEVSYVYQELDDIPKRFKDKFGKRVKPWGTGQAILCCKDIVNEPFLVINADDYYGKEAYKEAYAYLTAEKKRTEQLNICMVGFVLKNTLSENGSVTRGICKVNEKGMLTDIEETYGIEKCKDYAVAVKEGDRVKVDLESPVSMNMWGMQPEFFTVLEGGFEKFLDKLDKEDMKSEYLLPKIIGDMLQKKQVQVRVLESKDKWFGVTYQEDRELVVKNVRELVNMGVYPEKLF